MKNNINSTESQGSEKEAMPFNKQNYRFMLIGLAVLIAGFILMSIDQEEFGFGFLGLTAGPLVLFIGFIFQYFAILKR